MRIHFLGTGTSQGIPVIGSMHPVCFSKDTRDKRLRVSIWVEWDDLSLVVDCGPDFRYQMLRSGCARMDALLFTHEHADHTAGLDDIRPFFFRQGNIQIYGHKRVIQNLTQRFGYIFTNENKYPGAPSVDTHFIQKNEPLFIKQKEIIPIEVWHGNWQVFGFRMQHFAYLTDVKTIEEDQLGKLQNLDVLVLNALREEPHQTHLNVQEALDLVAILKPKKTYFTHISHSMGFHSEMQSKLPPNVFLAYDTLMIEI